MDSPLTARQRLVLEHIRSFVTSTGYPPTHRDIAAGLGFASTNGVYDHLKILERKGYIGRGDARRGQSRSTVILRGKVLPVAPDSPSAKSGEWPAVIRTGCGHKLGRLWPMAEPTG